MKLKDLIEGVQAEAGELEIAGLASDSRAVGAGFAFFALAGSKAHGGDYLKDALARGAICVVSAGDLGPNSGAVPIVLDNPRRALAHAAAKFHPGQPGIMAAVTGTNGKSSTVDFLRQIWAHAGLNAASLGTLGAIGPKGRLPLAHTTPDPIGIHQTLSRLASEGATHGAMEASSHGLDQHRLDGVRLAAGAFTNLTQDHLDYHRDFDSYRAAKLRLWDLLPKGAPAIINMDAREGEHFLDRAIASGLSPIECGFRAKDLKIRELWPRANSQRLDLVWRGQSGLVEIPLIGEFQALNAVTAAALALGLGLDQKAVFAGLERLQPVKGRMEHVGADGDGAHVFVDYAHTPDGLDVLLRAARPHAPGRVIVAFGCGGDRDVGKRAQMGAIAARFADVVIVTDDNPRSEDPAAIRAEILKGAPEALEIGDRRAAIRAGVHMMCAGDAFLIAGKGHETGQIVGAQVLAFSDQDEARAALEEKARAHV